MIAVIVTMVVTAVTVSGDSSDGGASVIGRGVLGGSGLVAGAGLGYSGG